ncbi:MAG: SLC13 family permease, partial [Bilophila wadsworthia]
MTLPMTGKNCSLALKWLISFAIPLIVYWAMPIDGQTVTHHMALFLSITTWAICIWAMDAMNEIAVGLILPVLYIVLCGVKQQVVYSPWLSEVPLIVIGGFALGKILQETGLGKRIGLTCVRCMGGSFTGTLIGITLAVSIVAPLVPAIWAMDAMNEIAVGLILPVLYIVLCGVKQQVVYSPWLSEVPLIVIGGFALGKILQETGLGKRIGLTCVRCMGGSFTGTLIGITLAVSIVAPLVPAITGKAAIFCAIGISLCDALDFKAKGREATAVILTCCLAVASTKLCYLTGGADLVLGMGLLQKASGISSTWMEYAMHNFLPGMLYT